MADMAKVMSIVREYSDARLADVLAGKDMSVPQFAAMTEAMGRKQLRQAVDGQQAQQQAQQPSVKDQLLAEQQAEQAQMSGIAALPAPNMEAMGEGMAGGGIIAFEEGGSTLDKLKDFFYARGEWAPEKNRMSGSYKGDEPLQGAGVPGLYKERQDEKRARAADIKEQMRLNALQPEGFGEPVVTSGEDPYGTANARSVAELKGPGVSEPPVAAPAAPAAAPKPAIDLSQPTKFERRSSPFGEMSAEKVDVEGLKNRGLGEGLMRLSAGLLSAPGAKGFSAGVAALAEQAGLTRKETNALKKDARDYDLNLKRAEAAFEQGQDELGLKFTEAANVNKYRMASLAKEPDALRVAREAIKDPRLAAIIGKEGKTELYSVEAATKAFNDILKDNRTYAKELAALGVRDPMSYRQFVMTGLPPMQVVGTLSEGAKVRS
jgi:hypothetical protein